MASYGGATSFAVLPGADNAAIPATNRHRRRARASARISVMPGTYGHRIFWIVAGRVFQRKLARVLDVDE
jgi:hypothetical protein